MNKTTPPMSCPPALFRWAIPRIISMGVVHRSGILPFQGGTTHALKRHNRIEYGIDLLNATQTTLDEQNPITPMGDTPHYFDGRCPPHYFDGRCPPLRDFALSGRNNTRPEKAQSHRIGHRPIKRHTNNANEQNPITPLGDTPHYFDGRCPPLRDLALSGRNNTPHKP